MLDGSIFGRMMRRRRISRDTLYLEPAWRKNVALQQCLLAAVWQLDWECHNVLRVEAACPETFHHHLQAVVQVRLVLGPVPPTLQCLWATTFCISNLCLGSRHLGLGCTCMQITFSNRMRHGSHRVPAVQGHAHHSHCGCHHQGLQPVLLGSKPDCLL